jgi:hypothetical protein
MKVKNIIFFALICFIFSGITTIGFVSIFEKEETIRLLDQNHIKIPETYTAVSISKGTILLLLAVGVIGVLGVSRKKKIGPGIFEHNEDDRPAVNQDFTNH